MTERGHSEKMEYKKEMGAQAAFCAPNVRFFQHPMREIAGYHTCQGYCLQNGAYELPNGVNFTISSDGRNQRFSAAVLSPGTETVCCSSVFSRGISGGKCLLDDCFRLGYWRI